MTNPLRYRVVMYVNELHDKISKEAFHQRIPVTLGFIQSMEIGYAHRRHSAEAPTQLDCDILFPPQVGSREATHLKVFLALKNGKLKAHPSFVSQNGQLFLKSIGLLPPDVKYNPFDHVEQALQAIEACCASICVHESSHTPCNPMSLCDCEEHPAEAPEECIFHSMKCTPSCHRKDCIYSRANNGSMQEVIDNPEVVGDEGKCPKYLGCIYARVECDIDKPCILRDDEITNQPEGYEDSNKCPDADGHIKQEMPTLDKDTCLFYLTCDPGCTPIPLCDCDRYSKEDKDANTADS